MTEKLQVVIPMAGFGARLRPFTLNKPKQLIQIAHGTMLQHVLASLHTLPYSEVEHIFIIGHMGDQIQDYMQVSYPDLAVKYVVQAEMKGQSHAIYQAKDLLEGPMLMVFADTLVETDLSFLSEETMDGVAWVQEVPDPRRFGIAVANDCGEITKVVEKPESLENRQAVVGFYYFSDASRLIQAIETQFALDRQIKGEFYLADAINILLEQGWRMRAEPVRQWLDAGMPETTLATNRYLLDNGKGNSPISANDQAVRIIAPVFIHPDAEVENSVIGPHASIGAGCRITGSIVRDSIIHPGTVLKDSLIQESIIGFNCSVQGRFSGLMLGDHSELRPG